MSNSELKLTSAASEVLTSQDYGKKSLLDGVKMVLLRRFTAEDGSFAEVVHLENGQLIQPEELKGFEVKQINHALVVPGTVKAWHLHFEQDEVWFIHPEAALLVGLMDVRDGSPTVNQWQRLCLGRGLAHLLYIPRGVAHGLSNPYGEPATMTYLVNNHFDGSDEKRLPAGFGVSADFWELRKG